MHRSLIALEKLANFALNVAGIWAIVTMIVHAFEFADRDYDWDNPRDSYRYTRADFVVYGFSLVECVLAFGSRAFGLSTAAAPLPAGYHYENFREDSKLVGDDIDKDNSLSNETKHPR
jgi:hypothetical protein